MSLPFGVRLEIYHSGDTKRPPLIQNRQQLCNYWQTSNEKTANKNDVKIRIKKRKDEEEKALKGNSSEGGIEI